MSTKFLLKQNAPNVSSDNLATIGEYVFDGGLFTIGSDEANSLVLPQSAGEQAVIVNEGDHLTLLNRAGGTRLNGQELRPEAIQPLAEGDEIVVGNYLILLGAEEFKQSYDTGPLKLPAELDNGNESDPLELPPPLYNGNKTGAIPYPTTEIEEKAEVAAGEAHSVDAARPAPAPAGGTRNFAAVLDTLRTEEDSFYFVVKNAEQETGRILLDEAEIPIGVGAKSELTFDSEQISSILAIVRKDWSGILIESQRRNSVFINGEPLEATRRLRNDDQVSFSPPIKSVLVLHESSLLVALEPLLSARSAAAAAENASDLALAAKQSSAREKKPRASLLERSYFGYFSFVEAVSMVIGTLIFAVVFFLLFEFIFS